MVFGVLGIRVCIWEIVFFVGLSLFSWCWVKKVILSLFVCDRFLFMVFRWLEISLVKVDLLLLLVFRSVMWLLGLIFSVSCDRILVLLYLVVIFFSFRIGGVSWFFGLGKWIGWEFFFVSVVIGFIFFSIFSWVCVC